MHYYALLRWAGLLFCSIVPLLVSALPTGRLLAASGAVYGGLMMYNLDGSRQVYLTADTYKMTASDGQHKSSHPSASTTELIAFQSNRIGSSQRIFVMRADGSHLQQLTTSAGLSKPAHMIDTRPVIAPNGTQVAFISRRSDRQLLYSSDIFLVNTDGSGLRQVTPSQVVTGVGFGSITSLAWSPDGTQIAFLGTRQATVNGQTAFHNVLGLINTAGTSEQTLKVLDKATTQALDWSPDGRTIVYTREVSGQTSFVLFDPVTRQEIGSINQVTLGKPSGAPGTVHFSPTSQRLLYLQDAMDSTKGCPSIINVDGTGRMDLPTVTINRDEALWWMAGPEIPTPHRLEITPPSIELLPDVPLSLSVALHSATGEVISRGAERWALTPQDAGTPSISSTGLLSGSSPTGEYTLTVWNGDQTATAPVRMVTSRHYQPDLLIRPASDPHYAGEDTYNTEVEQTASQAVQSGSAAVFYVQVQNDGNVSDTFRLTANAPAVGWRLRAWDADTAGNEISTALLGAGWTTPFLAPGRGIVLRVEVTPDLTIQGNGTEDLRITAVAVSDPAQTDTLVATTIKAPLSAVVLESAPQGQATVNTRITLSARATGGGTPEYRFRVGYPTDEGWQWTIIRDYAPSAQCTWTPTEARRYTVAVHAREVGSRLAYQAFSAVAYTVTEPLRGVALTASPGTPRPANTPIVLTATPTGGSQVEYQFRAGIKTASGWNWTTIRPYGAAATCTWTPQNVATYSLTVYARQLGSSRAYEAYAAITYSVRPAISAVGLTTAPLSQQRVNTPVTLTAIATGGVRVEYQFTAKRGTTTTVLQGYGTLRTCRWTPTQPGSYTLQVWAREVGSPRSYDAAREIPFTVAAPVTAVQLFVTPGTPQAVQTPIALRAAVTGGVQVQYQFRLGTLQNGTRVWSVLRDYSPTATCALTPTAPGNYLLVVYARETGSAKAYDAYTALTFKVDP